MRCEYCGWDNPDSNTVCEKCRQPLRNPVSGNFKGTIRDIFVPGLYDRPTDRQVPPSPETPDSVSADGTDNEPANQNSQKTVRPNLRKKRALTVEKKFRLVPIVSDDSAPTEPLEFEGSCVTLKRDNTEPTNLTISSRGQATVKCVDGCWNIVDRSSLETTFVRSSKPIPLCDGDIIMMGDSLFKFEPM